jgi:hypothetical protein
MVGVSYVTGGSEDPPLRVDDFAILDVVVLL